jgi:hypothetical protein
VFPPSYSPQSVSNLASASFTRNTTDAIRRLLWSPFFGLLLLREFLRVCLILKSVLISYLRIRCTFKIFRNVSCITYRYKTKWLNLLLQTNTSLRYADH